ncbi:MAG: type II restriction endonuclease [Candidatus Sumerlaeaceae bacterium]
MICPFAEQAVEEAVKHGNAILKYISPNDVGQTGGHQCGYYLPKAIWKHFTVNPPVKGENAEQFVTISWQNGSESSSRIIWYGKGTRSEYRLTRFGKDFPFLTHDSVGNLLVLIKTAAETFHAFVVYADDDIEELQARLSIEIIGTWAHYNAEKSELEFEYSHETEDECLNRQFRSFCQLLDSYPSGNSFSEATRAALLHCIQGYCSLSPDDKLMRCLESEYELFRMAERKICGPDVRRLFQSVDDFLGTANSILQRRKSRAGLALENHVEMLLTEAGVPFDAQPGPTVGRIDVIIPGKREYLDSAFPVEKLVAVGIKTTCKDRWAQVLKEAPRVKKKHILTTQKGISESQLKEMHEAGVTLIVPKSLQKLYTTKQSGMNILSLGDFIAGAPRNG